MLKYSEFISKMQIFFTKSATIHLVIHKTRCVKIHPTQRVFYLIFPLLILISNHPYTKLIQ